MYVLHPYVCTSRKFPTDCRRCGQRVVYWECDHGSKVFFDPPDRGEHQCGYSAMSGASSKPSPPRPSGKTALTSLSGVSIGVQSNNYGVMPGMRRGVARLRRSWTRMPESSGRETVPVKPYGDDAETLAGEVSAVFEIDIAERFRMPPNSVGGIMLGKTFPGLRATQITILVDDFLNDPDAVDKMSYTAWCPTGVAPSGLAKRAFVIAKVSPRAFMGAVGRRWVVESVDEA